MALSPDMQERYSFFRSQGVGARRALGLARAEVLLDRAVTLDVASVAWLDDPEPYETDYPEDVRGLESGALVGPCGCIVTVGPEFVTLWGVVVRAPSLQGDDPYLRVVAAELACELEDSLRQAIGDDLDAAPDELLPVLAAVYAVGGRA